jgi:hypothetical protein
MLYKIITLTEPTITISLPKEAVGKTLQLIISEIEQPSLSKTQRLKQIEDLTKDTLIDLSGFKFGRNEANDYSE